MKHYISTLEDDEVKAYCIMNDSGVVVACDSMRYDDKFYEDVERFSKYYNCIKIVEPTLEGQERIDKLRNRTYSKIPHISQVVANFFKTEKGEKMILDYIKEQDAIDYRLVEDLREYAKIAAIKDEKSNKY